MILTSLAVILYFPKLSQEAFKNMFNPLKTAGMASLTIPVKNTLAESYATLISSKL